MSNIPNFNLTYQSISPTKFNILSGVPGCGKSRAIINFCKNPYVAGRKLILSHSHLVLYEFGKYFPTRFIIIRHWRGMAKLCPLRTKNDLIKFLIEVGTPTRYICRLCHDLKLYDHRRCPYKKQFRKMPKVVVAPYEYVFTHYIEKFNPCFIFADDVTTKAKIYRWRDCEAWYNTLRLALQLDKKYTKREILDYLRSRADKDIYNYLRSIHNELLKDVTSGRVWEFIAKFDPLEIERVLKLYKLYGKRDKYAIPYLFWLFDLVGKHTVVLVEATPNKMFLEDMANRYFKEEGKRITFNYIEIPFKPCPESVIYRVQSPYHKNAWYPGCSVKNKVVRDAIRKRINKILEIVKPIRWAAIGYKGDKLVDLHYGNLKSSNSLEDCDVGFVIGSYNVNTKALRDEFRLFYPHRDGVDFGSHKTETGRYNYYDEKLENFRRMKEDYEVYQAIHRFRPALKR